MDSFIPSCHESDDETTSGVSSIQVGFTRDCLSASVMLLVFRGKQSLFLHSVCFYYVQVLGARDVAVDISLE